MRAVTAVLTGSTALLAAAPARATAHGKTGRFAFRRYYNADHTSGDILTINCVGIAERQVTHSRRTRFGHRTWCTSMGPIYTAVTHAAPGRGKWGLGSFSPNGQRIVASHSPGVGAAGNADVYSMKRRHSRARRHRLRDL
jgi:hypothetical protein